MKSACAIMVRFTSLAAFPALTLSVNLLAISSLAPVPLDRDRDAAQSIIQLPKISLLALPPIPNPKDIEPGVELETAGRAKIGPGSLITPREIAALEEPNRFPSPARSTVLRPDHLSMAAEQGRTESSPADHYGINQSVNYRFQLYGKIRGKGLEANKRCLKLHLRTPKGADWQAPITVGPKGKYSVELVLAALPDQTLEWTVTGSGVGIDAELAAGRRILTDAKDLVIKENIRANNP